MNIIYKDYKIKVEPSSYTLYKVGVVEKGKTKGESRESEIGYYTSMDSCIKKIIRSELAEKNEDVTLKEFLKQHNELLTELTKLING